MALPVKHTPSEVGKMNVDIAAEVRRLVAEAMAESAGPGAPTGKRGRGKPRGSTNKHSWPAKLKTLAPGESIILDDDNGYGSVRVSQATRSNSALSGRRFTTKTVRYIDGDLAVKAVRITREA